jgi:hypothetical protein
MIIDTLPDVALLEIFDFYIYEDQKAWPTLAHVCQDWRNVVFGSARRLNLRLYCKAGTPVRATLGVWPPLPIVIWGDGHEKWGLDNIVAALEHNDRICRIDLWRVPRSQLEKLLAAIQQPFPAMTRLQLEFQDEILAPIDPDLFLGGSAPCLQSLTLVSIPFPGLPKLFLSATHLVYLQLWRIPHSGYVSPEAMVAGLSVLTRLESLFIGFESPQCRPDGRTRRPPIQTRTVFPVLTELWFKGANEYLENLMARIDAPLLEKLGITFFHQLIFDTSQLTRFISRAPKFKSPDEARVVFSNWDVSLTLPQTLNKALEFGISCRQSDWQLSSAAQVFGSFFRQSLVPAVEHLYILENGFSRLHWQDDIENSQWLELLHSFTAVKSLYISSEFMPRIAPALQELVAERVTEVLPVLQTLFLEEPLPSGPVQEIIEQFVAARRLTGYPITVSCWDRT